MSDRENFIFFFSLFRIVVVFHFFSFSFLLFFLGGGFDNLLNYYTIDGLSKEKVTICLVTNEGKRRKVMGIGKKREWEIVSRLHVVENKN